MTTETLYEKWPQEEIFKHLMLQYNLNKSCPEIIDIPFRVIEWISNDGNCVMWNEENTNIAILMSGAIIFEGVRHCNFAETDQGYMNYPDLLSLSQCLKRLHELCIKHCRYYYE